MNENVIHGAPKKVENSEIAIWQKTVDTESCRSRQEDSSVKFCESTDANDVWYDPSFSIKQFVYMNILLLIFLIFLY